MKTITVKADERFDLTLTNLAKSLKTTKSGVIRAAVLDYKKQLERDALREQMLSASSKTRSQVHPSTLDFDTANADDL